MHIAIVACGPPAGSPLQSLCTVKHGVVNLLLVCMLVLAWLPAKHKDAHHLLKWRGKALMPHCVPYSFVLASRLNICIAVQHSEQE